MGGNGGGGGKPGRGGGGGGGSTLVEGGIPITKDLTGSQLIAAHASIVDRTDKLGDAAYDAAMKTFVSGLKAAGINEKTYKEGSSEAGKIKRFFRSYG
ncbi:hypothetical protein M0R72_08440 [Candidatus Pacearchaeota archaeon]|jgi:hypothetical protein|nr:hypothetical protein [Candidatus Pacearchaeota archaeon]